MIYVCIENTLSTCISKRMIAGCKMCMRRFIPKLRHAVKYLLVGAMVSVCLVIVLCRSSSKYCFKGTVDKWTSIRESLTLLVSYNEDAYCVTVKAGNFYVEFIFAKFHNHLYLRRSVKIIRRWGLSISDFLHNLH